MKKQYAESLEAVYIHTHTQIDLMKIKYGIIII